MAATYKVKLVYILDHSKCDANEPTQEKQKWKEQKNIQAKIVFLEVSKWVREKSGEKMWCLSSGLSCPVPSCNE